MWPTTLELASIEDQQYLCSGIWLTKARRKEPYFGLFTRIQAKRKLVSSDVQSIHSLLHCRSRVGLSIWETQRQGICRYKIKFLLGQAAIAWQCYDTCRALIPSLLSVRNRAKGQLSHSIRILIRRQLTDH